MKNTHVKDWMTSDPVIIMHNDYLPDAHRLMTEKKVRRLPVMDGDKLVGIITRGDVREASPSDATSLSIFELHYMLAQLPISEIMTTDVQTVSPDTMLGDAAKIMLESKIGGLPVMEGTKLVGIITESDIFRALVSILS